jgi:hypothetical protein
VAPELPIGRASGVIGAPSSDPVCAPPIAWGPGLPATLDVGDAAYMGEPDVACLVAQAG